MTGFVYFYAHLSAPFDVMAARLGEAPATWLPGWRDHTDDGHLLDLHADGALPSPIDHAPVWVQVGSSTTDTGQLRRPLRWTAAVVMDQLFPVLTGELELQRLPAHGCRLSLSGTYQPPGRRLGELADRLAGHRVAEACVRRFVLDTAAQLDARHSLS